MSNCASGSGETLFHAKFVLEADLHDLVFCFGFGQNQSKTFFWFCNGILTCQNKNIFVLVLSKQKSKQNRADQLGRVEVGIVHQTPSVAKSVHVQLAHRRVLFC